MKEKLIQKFLPTFKIQIFSVKLVLSTLVLKLFLTINIHIKVFT